MPARRPGGKAASRKARQRNVPRTPRPASTAGATTPADPVEATDPTLVADAPAGPAVPEPAASAPAAPPSSRRRGSAPFVGAGTSSGSGLSARDRADYHYVERDLRNIGILSMVMVALLIGAWLVFNALGLVG
jgi:hypothetical protein